MENKYKYYYHITPEHEDWMKIGQEGLKASEDGYIYLLITKDNDVVHSVALNQISAFKNYGLIRIDSKGITGAIENDDVAEYTTRYQRRVKQQLVRPEFIKILNMYKAIPRKAQLDT